MAKKKKQPVEKDKRKPPLVPIQYLAETAHQLFMLKPNETIILNRLKELWEEATDMGYQRHISDQRYFNSKRDARIKKSCDSLLQTIDDTIHGGAVAPKDEILNQNNN